MTRGEVGRGAEGHGGEERWGEERRGEERSRGAWRRGEVRRGQETDMQTDTETCLAQDLCSYVKGPTAESTGSDPHRRSVEHKDRESHNVFLTSLTLRPESMSSARAVKLLTDICRSQLQEVVVRSTTVCRIPVIAFVLAGSGRGKPP